MLTACIDSWRKSYGGRNMDRIGLLLIALLGTLVHGSQSAEEAPFNSSSEEPGTIVSLADRAGSSTGTTSTTTKDTKSTSTTNTGGSRKPSFTLVPVCHRLQEQAHSPVSVNTTDMEATTSPTYSQSATLTIQGVDASTATTHSPVSVSTTDMEATTSPTYSQSATPTTQGVDLSTATTHSPVSVNTTDMEATTSPRGVDASTATTSTTGKTTTSSTAKATTYSATTKKPRKRRRRARTSQTRKSDGGSYFDERGCRHKVLEYRRELYTTNCRKNCYGKKKKLQDYKPCLRTISARRRWYGGKKRNCAFGTCLRGKCVLSRYKVKCRVPERTNYYDHGGYEIYDGSAE